MAQGKQAKVLSDKQQSAVLHYLEESRYPIRNKTIFLLSMKAGLRAKEIASLRWRNVCDVSGEISDEIQIEDVGSKGKGGRTIPLNPALREALVEYQKETEYPQSDRFLVQSEKRRKWRSGSNHCFLVSAVVCRPLNGWSLFS